MLEVHSSRGGKIRERKATSKGPIRLCIEPEGSEPFQVVVRWPVRSTVGLLLEVIKSPHPIEEGQFCCANGSWQKRGRGQGFTVKYKIRGVRYRATARELRG